MPYSHAEDAMAHHAANTAAIAIPLGSVILHLPEILTACVSFMGIVWYGILIFDWACKRRTLKKQLKQSAGRVREKITEMPHADPADETES